MNMKVDPTRRASPDETRFGLLLAMMVYFKPTTTEHDRRAYIRRMCIHQKDEGYS